MEYFDVATFPFGPVPVKRISIFNTSQPDYGQDTMAAFLY